MSPIREDRLIFSHQLLPRAAHRDGARVFLSPRDADKSNERRGIRGEESRESLALPAGLLIISRVRETPLID